MDNPEFVVFGDIVEENGKSIRENNMEMKHNIPIGAVVSLEFDCRKSRSNGVEIHYTGTAQLYVVNHHRDCDGTPLYALADMPISMPNTNDPDYHLWQNFVNFHLTGYTDNLLTPTGFHAEPFYHSPREFLRILGGYV